MTSQQQEHDQMMAEAKQKQEEKLHKDELDLGYAKIEGDIQESKINALGRASDKDANQTSFDAIHQAAQLSLKQQELTNKNNQEFTKIQNDLAIASQNFTNKAKEISQNDEKIKLEREKLSTMKYIADARNRDSIINKN